MGKKTGPKPKPDSGEGRHGSLFATEARSCSVEGGSRKARRSNEQISDARPR